MRSLIFRVDENNFLVTSVSSLAYNRYKFFLLAPVPRVYFNELIATQMDMLRPVFRHMNKIARSDY
jgi:hypothetical protein